VKGLKAAAFIQPGLIQVFEIDKPVPDPGEVLVKIAVCGLCSSELGLWVNKDFKTEQPIFFGHEATGVVEEVGSGVQTLSVGDRVTLFTERGGYAEYIALPEKWAVKLADHVPFEWALGEPIACAMNGTKRSGVEVGDTVAIIGLGFMGGLIMQGIKLKGASRIIVVDTREESFGLARELGADEIINSKTEDAAARIMELTGNRGADVVVECTGYQAPLDLATQAVKIRGRLVIFGYHQSGPRTIDVQTWNWKGLDVVNAHERDPEVYLQGMKTGMRLLNAGQLNMKPLVSHFYPIEDINQAFEDAYRKPPGFIKAVIKNF
jgi:threonine dehydrogenase-like Zn-dependent dehydrogenase